MNKFIVLTVAFAAGLIAFAASAAELPNIPRKPLFATQKAASTKEAAKPAAKSAKASKTKAKPATSANLADRKPVIARTPLFSMQKTASSAETGKPAVKAARQNAKAMAAKGGKVSGAPKTQRKTAKLNIKKTKSAARTVKANSRKAKPNTTTVTEITLDAKTAAYPVKPDVAAKPGGVAGPYHAVIARYAAEYGVPVSLAHAVISVESSYRPNMTGSAGEVGLMQIKPATARGLGYSGSVAGLYDPETNIRFGMKYLAMAHELGGGTTCGTILKYNAGHGARRMNPVSQAYCGKVQRLLAS
ncbi:lytic transglycosylase domain-containing protein [Mesorhizobium sp. IMUNJ 23232]|uniref:lytic transglycosylase domain-containing protein n=1 Tax=Mesorhizobium sp. IMUNJ 23232 TaxID=3376064 RepID=UPI0037A68011